MEFPEVIKALATIFTFVAVVASFNERPNFSGFWWNCVAALLWFYLILVG
jgi:hypothetical protein